MRGTRTALPWGWLALVLGAVAVYLLGLDSPFAPTNGDEMVYIHIARSTMESGHWLPLQSELAHMRNTKPPLLFWQALVSTDWGGHWSRFALRLPSVLCTLATAALLGWTTWLMARRAGPTDGNAQQAVAANGLRTALIAAAVFLLFFSSFRYSRVFLTSAAETFWLALPLWWVVWRHLRAAPLPNTPPGWFAHTLFGVALGVGAAYKSFALLAPAAATLGLVLLIDTPRRDGTTLLRATVRTGYSTLIGLAVFALWFVLDPDPAAVWQEFVVGENAGKLSGAQGYWHAALFGTYPMWTQLFAYPENAGVLALPVFGLAAFGALALRRRQVAVAPAVWMLVGWLLVWLVVFSIPSQRSARYLIPAMPALAILMALAWERIARPWFWFTLLTIAPLLVVLARIAWVMQDMGMATQAELAWTLAAAGAGLGCVVCGLAIGPWCRAASLGATLSLYATFGFMVAPLSEPKAEFAPEVQERMAGERVAVPNGFTGQFERFHFLLPAATLVPYDTDGRNTGERYPELPADARLMRLLDENDAVVWVQDSLQSTAPGCVPACAVIAQRWHVKSRHKGGEVTLDNLWYPQQWLFRAEWLVVRQPR